LCVFKVSPVVNGCVEALQTYLEIQEREEAVVEAAKEAWAEFQAAGQGADWDEVRGWIASWSGPSEPPAPKY
jgi:predicted transcriptional regulator